MRSESLDFLRELLTTPTPSGYESAGQKLWCQYVRQWADEVHTDAYGNAVAVLNPKGDPKILIDGHIDEIGLMVKHIDDKGFIYFQSIGGVDPALVSGKRVNIHAQKGVVRGVIGATAIHLKDKEKDSKSPKMHEVFIDIGATDGKAVKRKVAVGDPITFVDDFEMLDKNIAVSRALDNRIGVWVAAEVLRVAATSKAKPKCALYACSSIQEETGCNGAQMQVFNVQPHAAIAVDVTHATDSPGIDSKLHGEVKLGKGPTVSIGRENHPVLVERLRKTAATKKIPLQVETFSKTGGTDAYVMWTKNGGVPSAITSPPIRYMHSTVELMDLRDLQRMVDWLGAFVLDLKKGERFKVKV
ncbi:MAG: M42 family metallopeptidase [Phycisphaerae bacterium]|nr:M42 family metallopeptidase [Phycisphaerae bacterium]